MKKEMREQVGRLEAEGFTYGGRVRSGHLLLTHPCGVTMRIACTPSDPRSRLNELARARRKVREAVE